MGLRTIMTGDVLKTALRLPRPLHEKIIQAAAANGRSMNTEIVERLQESFNMDAESGEEENRARASIAAQEMLAIFRETINRLPGEVVDALESRMKGAGSSPNTLHSKP